MSQDPHGQLLLRIRGTVAEYKRTLIAERMRRVGWPSCVLTHRCPGAARRSATAWMLTGPRCGRGPGRAGRGGAGRAAVRLVSGAAGDGIAARRRLIGLGVATPTSKPCWNAASMRDIPRAACPRPAYPMNEPGPGIWNGPRGHVQCVPKLRTTLTFTQVRAVPATVCKIPDDSLPGLKSWTCHQEPEVRPGARTGLDGVEERRPAPSEQAALAGAPSHGAIRVGR